MNTQLFAKHDKTEDLLSSYTPISEKQLVPLTTTILISS